MRKTHISLSALLIVMALSGCMHNNAKDLPPGRYERSSTTVDSKGTARASESSTNVYYDENGHKKSTVDTKTSTDPKGLFNKSTTKTHATVK
jgi:hypothetical protein